MFVAITLVFWNNTNISAKILIFLQKTLMFLQKHYANKQDNNDY
jgi:hypothetical protein